MTTILEKNTNLNQQLTNSDVTFQHKLAQSGMFDDEQLAVLIDIARKSGPEHYTLGSLDKDGVGEKWQNGVFGDLSGAQILEAIAKGHLWLQIQNLKEIAPDYYNLAEQGFAELKQENGEFSYHKLTSNILISSPSAKVLCHLDCAEVILWHIRGRKRLYLYDLTKKVFADEKTIEKVIMRETEEEIPYNKDWDDLATVYELESGEAISWPHFWPHRVENIEGLNVSMQTEFYSDKGLKQYGVRFANGILRRKTGVSANSTTTIGAVALAKAGLGLVSKKIGLYKPVERKITSQFTIDPHNVGAIRQFEQNQQSVLDK